VVSQIKSIVQLLFGQTSQALDTQINFVDSTPILSQLKSLYEAFGQDDWVKAAKTQEKFLIVTSATIDGIPLVGHVKGLGHYFIGDAKRGHQAMKRADRTTVVVLCGYFACTIMVPTTASLQTTVTVSALSSMTGGFAMDTLLTMLENAMHKEGALNGCYHAMARVVNEPDAGNVFDFIVGPLLDGLLGAFVGFKMYQIRNPPVAPPTGPQTAAAQSSQSSQSTHANHGVVRDISPNQKHVPNVLPVPPPPVPPVIKALPLPAPVVTVPVTGHVLHPRLPLPIPFNPNVLPTARTAVRYGAAASVVQRHVQHN